MRWFGLAMGALLILVGAITVAVPGLRLAMERSIMTPAGLYVVAAVRIAIGLGFLLAARAAQTPRMIRVFGLIVILAGLLTPWFGVTRAHDLMNWLENTRPLLMRVDAVVAMAIGAFLVYVFRLPAQRAA
jgi:hypothetical protein